MNNIKHIGLAAIFFFTACDGTREKSSEDNLQIAQCLMAKDYKYEDMLTKEDIAKHVPIDKQSFKVEVSPVKGAYGSCSYEWDSDRPDTQIELLGQLIPVPDKNRVTIKMLNFYTDSDLKLYSQQSASELFDQSYKKINPQEYGDLLSNLEKKYTDDLAGFEQAKGFLDSG